MNPKNQEAREKLARKIEKNRVASSSRHFILCAQSGCCKDIGEAKATQKCLSKGRRELRDEGVNISVSSAKCFNLCAGGPILYDATRGVWYGRVTPEVCALILRELEEGGEGDAPDLEPFIVARDGARGQTGEDGFS